jgi:hypothetical protein
MKEYIGEYVVIAVKYENVYDPFLYNGKLLSLNGGMITIEDVLIGNISFPRRSVVNIRKMTEDDVANKSEKWQMRLKFSKADDKVKRRFQAILDAFKGGK